MTESTYIAIAAVLVSFVFGGFASIFSFLMYLQSRERLRLELFERRWLIYEDILIFCYRVLQYGGTPRYENSEESIKRWEEFNLLISSTITGKGFHKAQVLFGPEVSESLVTLRNAYAFFSAYRGNESPEIAKEKHENMKRIGEFLDNMPIIFGPYLNFNHYRSR